MPSAWAKFKQRRARRKQVDPNLHKALPGMKWDEGIAYDSHCGICHQRMDNFDRYPCHVCVRCFHLACMEQSGLYRASDLRSVQQACTPRGWSCYDCADICGILPRYQVDKILRMVADAQAGKGERFTYSEYLTFCNERSLEQRGHRLREAERRVEELLFRCLDKDENGSVSWQELVNHEACKVMAGWEEERLVELLTAAEVQRARNQFSWLDGQGDGLISDHRVPMSYRHWYVDFEQRHWLKTTSNKGDRFELNKHSQIRGRTWRHTLRKALDRLTNYFQLRFRGYCTIFHLQSRYSTTSFSKSESKSVRLINFEEYLSTNAFFMLSSRSNRFHETARHPVNMVAVKWAGLLRNARTVTSSSSSEDSETGSVMTLKSDVLGDISGKVEQSHVIPTHVISPDSISPLTDTSLDTTEIRI